MRIQNIAKVQIVYSSRINREAFVKVSLKLQWSFPKILMMFRLPANSRIIAR